MLEPRDALQRGEITAMVTVSMQCERLRAVAARTNCVAAWNEGAALARAESLDRRYRVEGPVGPLHGIPITVKDWIDVADLPCTGGIISQRDRVPARNAPVVERLHAAGAVVVAKTTVQVDSELFGAVLHPADPSRSPGGSSSGEAAAVGGGGSILGIASDSGGSIRVPAAWCGVAAMKPSAGLVPTTGHFPRVGERADGRTQIGAMAGSVAALAAVLPVIAGPDGVDGGVAPVPPGDPSSVRIEGLRIGWWADRGRWQPQSAIDRGVQEVVAALVGLGAVPVGAVDQHLDEALDVTERYWRRSAGVLPGTETERHLADWDRYRSRMLRATAAVDLVVMPAAPIVAPTHRPMEPSDYIYTLPASLTGAPAVVVPYGSDEAGLPVAVQIVAARWRDDLALAAGIALERASTRG